MASTLLSVVQFLALLASSQAFAPVATSSVRPGSEPLQMIDFSDVITTASNSMWLATIDGDIANISDNEFKTVFAGGITVMFGGVLSVLIVGFILDRGDLYTNVAAESYLQSSEDEDFWKGLSEEEQNRAKDVLEKIKESKGEVSTNNPATTPMFAAESASVTEDKPAESSKPDDMFSDY